MKVTNVNSTLTRVNLRKILNMDFMWFDVQGFELIAIDFEPDQLLKKIKPAPTYSNDRSYYGNGLFINRKELY